MKTKATDKGMVQARQTRLAVFLGGLLPVLVCLSLISPAHSSVNETPVREANGAVTIGDFTLTPGNADTRHWSSDNAVLANFNVRRKDGQPFVELGIADVTAKLDTESVSVEPHSLKPKTGGVSVLLMIDKSRSMEVSNENHGVNKLHAAKESLRFFIDKLARDDQAAIFAFNLKPDPVIDLTHNKDDLKAAIDRIEASGDTAIYKALDNAQEEARNKNIKNIIFLSDGKDDPGRGKSPLSESEKTKKEEAISRIARDTATPIYAIALGDEVDKETMAGVDFATMDRISRNSNGGSAELIDIPKLNLKTGGDPAKVNEKLIDDLKEVLLRIKGKLQFDYEQPVVLRSLHEGAGTLELTVTLAEEDKRTVFQIDYPYSWTEKNGSPIFFPAKVAKAFVFINIKPSGIEWRGLMQIYLLLLLSLLLLALLPSVVSRIAVARAMYRMRHAIEVVGRGSPLLGKQCPNEMGAGERRYLFREGDTVVLCPLCSTAHHLSCWEYNQHRCMNRVCEYEFLIPDRLLDKYRLIPEGKKRFV